MPTNIFTLEPKYATFIVEDGIEQLFEYSVDRADFATKFNAVDFSSTRQISVEPARNLFHIVEVDHSLVVCGQPSDDERIDYINSNMESIKTWFEAKKTESETPEEPVAE